MTAIFGIIAYGKGAVFLEIGISAILYIIISRVIGAISREDIEWGRSLLLD